MTKLIHLRQRLKTIETIKKVTHAMRLIAISSHSHLKIQRQSLVLYDQTIARYLTILHHELHDNQEYRVGSADTDKGQLMIVVGSQKGLCGTFNQSLLTAMNVHADELNDQIITVGKKASELIKGLAISNYVLVQECEPLKKGTIVEIAQMITAAILHGKYQQVTAWHNTLKTFFIQQPTKTVLLPFDPSRVIAQETTSSITDIQTHADYLWNFTPQELYRHLSTQYLQSQIQILLIDSLLAEQAARFISMDNATRNAQRLADSTKLSYNKLRQAKITSEINELSGSFW